MATEMMRVMDFYQGGTPARICARGAHWDITYGQTPPRPGTKHLGPLMSRDCRCSCKTPEKHIHEVTDDLKYALDNPPPKTAVSAAEELISA